MTNYREILRLDSIGLNKTEIAASCGCSRNTVSSALKRAEECGLNWPLPAGSAAGGDTVSEYHGKARVQDAGLRVRVPRATAQGCYVESALAGIRGEVPVVRRRAVSVHTVQQVFNGAVSLLNLTGDAAQSRRNQCSIRPVLAHSRGGIFNSCATVLLNASRTLLKTS